MTTRKNFLKGLCLGVTGLFISDCSDKKSKKNPTEDKNPYEYNVDTFKKYDPKLLLYNELAPIKIKAHSLKSIAIGNKDSIYILADNKILQMDQKGKILKKINVAKEPFCITATDNVLYIALKSHVEAYHIKSKKKSFFCQLDENALITSMSVYKDKIIIADRGNKLLWLFDTTGKLIRMIGHANKKKDVPGFLLPGTYFDAAFDSSGNIWAVNAGRLILEKYSQSGERLAHWGGPSMEISGFVGCCNPVHFAILPNGQFITAEKGIPRIKVYSKKGKLKGVVAGPEKFKEETMGLDLTFDSRGRIYALDPAQKLLRIFVKK